MVTQITPSPQRAPRLPGVFCPRSHLSSSPWNRRHISPTWITQCQLITGFGPTPETCPHLIPSSSQWHQWECGGWVWEAFYSLSAFFLSISTCPGKFDAYQLFLRLQHASHLPPWNWRAHPRPSCEGLDRILKLVDLKRPPGDYPAARSYEVAQTMHFYPRGSSDKVTRLPKEALRHPRDTQIVSFVALSVESSLMLFSVTVECLTILAPHFCDAIRYYYISLDGLSTGNLIFWKARQSLSRTGEKS